MDLSPSCWRVEAGWLQHRDGILLYWVVKFVDSMWRERWEQQSRLDIRCDNSSAL